MANAVWPKYKQSILSESDTGNGLDTTGSTLGTFLALAAAGYTYNATHQFYSSLSSLVGTDMEITTPTNTNGTFDGDNVTFTAVTGSAVVALIFYRKNAGANTTWRLVLFMDASVTGLPVTPNGGDIQVSFNPSGIFTISDRRAKERVDQIGFIGALPVYEYSYLGERRRHVGVMAQEAERVVPGSVIEFRARGGSRKAVNYRRVIDALAA